MHYARTGTILLARNYNACVRFYRDTLDLPEMFRLEDEESRLTCLEFGGSYLMIEPDDRPWPEGTTIGRLPTKFRFNVEDLDAAVEELDRKGVALARTRHAWGDVADFLDPDGNPCQLRSESDFTG